MIAPCATSYNTVSKEIWPKNMRHDAIKLENGDGCSVRGRDVKGIGKLPRTSILGVNF